MISVPERSNVREGAIRESKAAPLELRPLTLEFRSPALARARARRDRCGQRWFPAIAGLVIRRGTS
jgi:hypothetical protein